ncbi:MAG: radical SAM protein [bacterium]|nr:radical SAM protein [bacterium]
MKKKIILLNPPGTKTYFRDYYCADIAKAHYVWPPFELVYQSGILAGEVEVRVLDAIAEKLSPRRAQAVLAGFQPDVVLSLVGSLSWGEDLDFLRGLKTGPLPLIIVSGDIPRFEPEITLRENPFLDAILLDPLSPAINQFIFSPGKAIPGIACRKNGGLIIGEQVSPAPTFSLPLPRYELFPIRRYGFPFSPGGKWGITLTSFGCPYHCSFCNTGTLGFRLRETENLLEELRFLKSLGITHLLFREANPTNRPERAREIMERMIAENFGFNWICQARPDTVDPNLLRLMKAAGCSLIMFGIESGNETVREKYKFKMSNPEVVSLFQTCREIGIQTLAHFILGLPGDNRETIEETIKFASSSQCDFASFNSFRFRPGITLDAARSETIPAVEIEKFRVRALERFYLNPSYLYGRLRRASSPRSLIVQAGNGITLLRNILFGSG